MGGVKSRPKITYNTPVIRYDNIKPKKPIIIKKINRSNYNNELMKYKLTDDEINKIKCGLYCKRRINEKVDKYIFNEISSSIFEMSCYTFKIVKNKDNDDREVEIIKNTIRCYANATQTTENKGWGILFWYRKNTTENRRLTFNEIEKIKNEMKSKLNHKLLYNK